MGRAAKTNFKFRQIAKYIFSIISKTNERPCELTSPLYTWYNNTWLVIIFSTINTQ